MKVTINSLSIELEEGTTLAALLELRNIPSAGIATAVNDTVVPAAARGAKVLSDGDTVTVIKAFYGG